MSLRRISLSLGLVFGVLCVVIQPADAQNYASQVVDYAGLGDTPYGDPNAVLGQPTTLINGGDYTDPVVYHASMVYGPYNTDPGGNPLIVTTGDSGYVTVKFDTPIVHDNRHWYGDDIIVFGNPFFSSSQLVDPDTDMSADTIAPSGALYQNGRPSISVSADGTDGSFVTLPDSQIFYPTDPYSWNYATGAWDDSSLHDFTKPVNPALTQHDFGGKSVAYAANTLYDNSAGGAAYSLAGLTDSHGNPLTSVSYIRFTGTGGSSVVDAVSRVSINPASAPEPGGVCIFALGALGLVLLRRNSLFSSRKGIL